MSRDFGNQAELEIVSFLQKDNFIILEQNYKKFFGEIDIIATKNKTIVFVEVKARKNNNISLFQLVSRSKQEKIIKTAKDFLSINPKFMNNYIIRFDVALILKKIDNTFDIDYIANAFQI